MTGTLHIIVLTATLAVLANASPDYCRLASCGSREHTICKYGFLQVDRRRCREVASTSLTPKEISEILNMHNQKRAFVASGAETRGLNGGQPAASNLGPLIWDKELANIAQTWANQCNFSHDKCRDSARFYVGQNIAHGWDWADYAHKFTDFVQGWYNEVDIFDASTIKHVSGWDTPLGQIGHYTQMMWADTKTLGCGGTRFRSFLNGRYWYETYLVCNYGPGGNLGGEMYKTR